MSNNKVKIMYSVEEIISLGTQVGTKIAFEKFQSLTQESLSERHQRRFRNTKELLKNFPNLKFHAKKAIYKAEHKDSSAIEILEEIEIKEKTLFIESIKESASRTYIIINHIEKMLRFYSVMAKNCGKIYKTRWEIISDVYLARDKKNIDEIAEKMSYSSRQIERQLNDAIEDLSGLIFGIDGIKIQNPMSKSCRRHVK